jgi:hypothetical protein
LLPNLPRLEESAVPSTYVEMALTIAATVAVIGLGLALIVRYRRETIEEECEPESDLDVFHEAYFDGEMSAEELARVREALGRRGAGPGPRVAGHEAVGGSAAVSPSPPPSPLTDPNSDGSRPGSD